MNQQRRDDTENRVGAPADAGPAGGRGHGSVAALAVVLVAAFGLGSCSGSDGGGDDDGERITRIDGPASVDGDDTTERGGG